jgi:leucyl aminopeptidase
MRITFSEPKLPTAGAVVVGVIADRKLLPTAKQIDGASKGALTRAMKASRFTGAKGQWLEVVAPAGVAADRVLLAGLGTPAEADALAMEAVGGGAVGKLLTSGVTAVTVICDAIEGAGIGLAESAARLGYGARLAAYRFDKYRTTEKPEAKPSLTSVTVGVKGAAEARKSYAPLDKVADGVFFTRDLVSEPGNVVYPASFAKELRALQKLGVEVEVLGEKQLEKLGMRALLGVGQGSTRESHVVIMQWNGGRKRDKPVAFIGKGVTFDTGGISIKPGPGMEEMKWDMGGAGTVSGLMKALAGRKAKVNAVGLVGLVENMPDGNAQRPGDIVTSMSGQTIEILNTDAEGRLVLADVLWFAQQRFKPQFMVDLATLTGAIIISLGSEHAGLFSNDDELATRIAEAGRKEGELAWRLPLSDAYDKMINCDAADMQNIGKDRGAGSITAAQFLQRFVNKVPWAHLDIAGVAWSKSAKPTVPKGGTGWGVRLLDRLVADYYEG